MSHKNRPAEQHYRAEAIAAIPRENCERPDKVAYPTRAAAKRARKRARDGLGKLSAYLCACGNWHLGRLPGKVRNGTHPRNPR